MKRFLSVFTAVSALILALGCTQPGANPPADATPPADAESVTDFGGAASNLRVGGELTNDAQDTLRGGEFTVSYTFAAGKWKSGLKAVLYLGDTLIVEAKDNATTEDKATFPPLPRAKNLLAGGNLMLKFRFGSGNPSGGKPLLLDKTPPTISKAELDGNALTLTLTEVLIAFDTITGDGGFTVTGTTTTFTVQRVEIPSGPSVKTVILTLDKTAQSGETVTLTYSQPTAETERIKDKAGNALASVTTANAVSVTVKPVPTDTTPPRITKAERSGATLTLTMNEALAARTGLANSGGFTLTGSAVASPTTFAVTAVAAINDNATTVKLTFTGTVQSGEVVKLTYTQPAEDDRIKDKAGNALASFVGENAVTVKAGPADTTPPTIVSAHWAAGGLELVMSEPLRARPIISGRTGGFEFQGTTATVFRVALFSHDTKKVLISWKGDVSTVALIYTRPAAEADWLTDPAGNALASFTDPISATPRSNR